MARRRDTSHIRRVVWLSGPEFKREEIMAIAERFVVVAEWLATRARQMVVVVVGAVCGPLEGKPGDRAVGSWAVDFGSWVRVPPWWFGSV